MLKPDEYQHVFGKTWIDKQAEPLLQIGNKKWTRYELVSKVGCGNFKAVNILFKALSDLEIKSLKALTDLPPATLASIKGVGVTTLFAAMSLLDSEGVDVDKWYDAGKTFLSLKQSEQKRADSERRERRRRRRK